MWIELARHLRRGIQPDKSRHDKYQYGLHREPSDVVGEWPLLHSLGAQGPPHRSNDHDQRRRLQKVRKSDSEALNEGESRSGGDQAGFQPDHLLALGEYRCLLPKARSRVGVGWRG